MYTVYIQVIDNHNCLIWKPKTFSDYLDCGTVRMCQIEKTVPRLKGTGYKCATCLANELRRKNEQVRIVKDGEIILLRLVQTSLPHTELVEQLAVAFQEGLKGYPENKPEWSV